MRITPILFATLSLAQGCLFSSLASAGYDCKNSENTTSFTLELGAYIGQPRFIVDSKEIQNHHKETENQDVYLLETDSKEMSVVGSRDSSGELIIKSPLVSQESSAKDSGWIIEFNSDRKTARFVHISGNIFEFKFNCKDLPELE